MIMSTSRDSTRGGGGLVGLDVGSPSPRSLYDLCITALVAAEAKRNAAEAASKDSSSSAETSPAPAPVPSPSAVPSVSVSLALGAERGLVLTEVMRMDLLLELRRHKQTKAVMQQLAKLTLFLRLLSLGERRSDLHHLVAFLVNSGYKMAEHYVKITLLTLDGEKDAGVGGNLNEELRFLRDGNNVASFLSDAGWFNHAAQIFQRVVQVVDKMLLEALGVTPEDPAEDNAAALAQSQLPCQLDESVADSSRTVALLDIKAESSVRQLSSLAAFCKFQEAQVRRSFRSFKFT